MVLLLFMHTSKPHTVKCSSIYNVQSQIRDDVFTSINCEYLLEMSCSQTSLPICFSVNKLSRTGACDWCSFANLGRYFFLSSWRRAVWFHFIVFRCIFIIITFIIFFIRIIIRRFFYCLKKDGGSCSPLAIPHLWEHKCLKYKANNAHGSLSNCCANIPPPSFFLVTFSVFLFSCVTWSRTT